MTGPPDDDISGETMEAVARARTRAATALAPGELATLLADAARSADALTADDIRALGAAAIRNASQVSFLLGKLAGLLDEAGDQDG